MPADPVQQCQLTLWNFISQNCLIVNTIYMPRRELLRRCSYNTYACWPSVTVTIAAAVQTCILVECCCKMDACWTVATQSACLLTFCHSILHVCWRCASLSAIPACMVSHYQPCLLVWCFIIGHAFCFGAPLTAMPVGVVPHYRSCLLVWCLTAGHVFWCGASLWAMPVGVVPHYRPCLLVRFVLQPTFGLVECWRKRDGYKSGATLTEVPLHQTCLLIQCYSQICLLVQCNSIRHACWVHLFRYTCL